MVFRVNARVPSVENELRGDGTRAHSRVVTAWFDEIYNEKKKRLIPPDGRECVNGCDPDVPLTWEEDTKTWERGGRHDRGRVDGQPSLCPFFITASLDRKRWNVYRRSETRHPSTSRATIGRRG
jgi:hypothetical protein